MPYAIIPMMTHWNLRATPFAVIALVAMVVFTVPALMIVTAQFTLFNPQVYKDELVGLGVYRDYPAILGRTLASGGDLLLPGFGDRVLGAMDAAHYDQVVRLIFPESWVRAQSESMVDQFWAYFNLQSPDLSLTVDFSPIKARLSSGEELQITQAIVAGLPNCRASELFNFGLNALQGNPADLPLCRPPDQFLNLSNALVDGLLRLAAGAAPDQANFAWVVAWQRVIPVTANAQQDSGALWRLYVFLRQVGPWLPLFSALFCGFAFAFGRFTRQGSLAWGGLALALPGVIGLAIALALGAWSSVVFPLLVGQLFFSSLAVFQVLVQLAQAVGSRWILLVGEVSLGMALVGVILMGTGAWLNRRSIRRNQLER